MGINAEIWTFPCDVNLKAIGLSCHPMLEVVAEVLAKHVESFSSDQLNARPSRNGKYTSVTANIRLHSQTQVETIYAELGARDEVAWTL